MQQKQQEMRSMGQPRAPRAAVLPLPLLLLPPLLLPGAPCSRTAVTSAVWKSSS